MHTSRTLTPEAAALEKRSRGRGDALVALMVAGYARHDGGMGLRASSACGLAHLPHLLRR